MIKFEQAYAQLIQEKVVPKLLAVMLRPKDLRQPCDVQKVRLQQHTIERAHLLETFRKLFVAAIVPEKLYRGTGLYFAELTYQEHREVSLFDHDHARHDREAVEAHIQTTVDRINLEL